MGYGDVAVVLTVRQRRIGVETGGKSSRVVSAGAGLRMRD